MTDRPDPRLSALSVRDVGRGVEIRPLVYVPPHAQDLLDAIDAADRAAGIVRVDTRDDLEGALDMLTSILRADIGAGFRDGGLRLTAALDRVERLLAALREAP